MALRAPRFEGFPSEAFDFYDALALDNTKAWWNQHKGEYERAVRGPMELFVAELAEEFGLPHVFRPYKDARFSRDSSPIKDHQGAVVRVEDSIAYYVQVSAQGIFVAGGWYAPEGQQTVRYRASVDGSAGSDLERIVRGARRRFTVDGNPLKTRPRGYAPDHPRLELLRNRRLTLTRAYPVEPRLHSRAVLNVVRADWRAMRPLVEWLADYVGPAAEPS